MRRSRINSRGAEKPSCFQGASPSRSTTTPSELLVSDLTSPKGDLRGYFTSMTRLQTLHPDLWLPTNPVDGQNANLYDKDWERTIEDNLYVIKFIISSR